MKRYFTILVLTFVLSASSLFAQEYYDYYVPPGYYAYYDYDHKVLQREVVYCNEDYMDLWNGHSVRMINGYSYIYDESNTRIIYGKYVNLVSTGNYLVNYGDDVWKLYDSEGDYTGVWGYDFNTFWNGCYQVYIGGVWKLYDKQNSYMGLYSQSKMELCWNGCYIYDVGNGQYRVADSDGDYIGVWGDEIKLMHNGNFRTTKGNYYYYYDKKGNRVN